MTIKSLVAVEVGGGEGSAATIRTARTQSASLQIKPMTVTQRSCCPCLISPN